MIASRHRPRVQTALAAGLLVAVVAFAGVATGQEGGVEACLTEDCLVGAGSSYPLRLIEQLAQSLAADQPPMELQYTAVGSKDGREEFIDKKVDFALSDVPFTAEEANHARTEGGDFAYAPVAAGGLGFVYNLLDGNNNKIKNVKLSPRTIARIFTGEITNWTDNADVITDNGGTAPVTPFDSVRSTIRPIVRADTNGTTWAFTSWIKAEAPDVWQRFTQKFGLPDAPVERWPSSGSLQLSGETPQSVAGKAVAQVGSIAYLPPIFAKNAPLPGSTQTADLELLQVKNKAGNFVLPDGPNAEKTLAEETIDSDNLLVPKYDVAQADAYPIVMATYLIARLSGTTPEVQTRTARFLQYVIDHPEIATGLGYAQLSPAVVDATKKVITQLQTAASTTTTTTSTTTSSTDSSTTTTIPSTSSTTTTVSSTTTTTTTAATVSSGSGSRGSSREGGTQVFGSALAATGAFAWRWKLELGILLVLAGELIRRRQPRRVRISDCG
jgi:phosphate transport system substrate-binding protein